MLYLNTCGNNKTNKHRLLNTGSRGLLYNLHCQSPDAKLLHGAQVHWWPLAQERPHHKSVISTLDFQVVNWPVNIVPSVEVSGGTWECEENNLGEVFNGRCGLDGRQGFFPCCMTFYAPCTKVRVYGLNLRSYDWAYGLGQDQ